jgi:hypothetical protein
MGWVPHGVIMLDWLVSWGVHTVYGMFTLVEFSNEH